MTAMPEPVPFTPEGPQPLVRAIAPSAPYPVNALGPLAAAALAAADISQAPIAIAAQSALTVASLAVQGFANVETLGGDAPASLWALTIAESGERKSTCDRLLTRALRDYETEHAQGYRKDLAAHKIAHELWTAKRRALVAAATKSVEAEADLSALGEEPIPPLLPNLTVQEPTFEGLLTLYRAGRPSLGLFADEAGGFIGGHAMNSDNRLKTIAGLSQLWNGDTVNRIRAGDGVTDYPGRRLAAHLLVQPIAAGGLLSDPVVTGQGFLSRFLIAQPESHIGQRLRREHDPQSLTALSGFAANVRRLLERPLPVGDNPQVLTPPRLALSPPAKELLWRYHEAVERAQAPGGEMEEVRAFASKSAEQAARIAGVLTLWVDPEGGEVAPDAMAQGIHLAQFYLHEAKRLTTTGHVPAKIDAAERLRCWLIERWEHGDIALTEIAQRSPLRNTAAAREAMATLEAHGWVEALAEGVLVRGKSRKSAWRIVKGAV